jgi:hypothetical protein
VAKKAKKIEIIASRRVHMDVDLALLNGQYRHRLRSKRGFYNSMISWIYLHGHELDRKIENRWVKYWLYKHCFDSGTMKTLASESITSCQQHLKNAHSIYPPGVVAPTPIESYFEEVYPLAAER